MYRQQQKNYPLSRGSQDRFSNLNKQYFKKFFIDGLTIAWSNDADVRLKAYTGQL